MRANSRSRIRWRVATAVVALALCALPKVALADGGGNGRLLAVKLAQPTDDAETSQNKEQSVPDAGANPTSKIDQKLSDADDGDLIPDDSDVASVDGSANDDAAADPAGELFGGSY